MVAALIDDYCEDGYVDDDGDDGDDGNCGNCGNDDDDDDDDEGDGDGDGDGDGAHLSFLMAPQYPSAMWSG